MVCYNNIPSTKKPENKCKGYHLKKIKCFLKIRITKLYLNYYVDFWTTTFKIPGYASQSKSDIPKLSSLNVITKNVFN